MKKLLTEEFIYRAKIIHGDKYDYSRVICTGSKDKVEIYCKKHNYTFLQQAGSHLQGCRCPKCNRSSHLEDDVRYLLNINNIIFEEQKTWDWLIYNSNQHVDFYLPKYNIVIECQGIQHFESVKFFGGEQNFNETVLRDKNKLNLCTENGIKILYYSNLGDNYPYEVITSPEDLINEINKIG